ncbi:hypothetical protein QFZ51_003229 [Chitinophaga sp. W3I9]|uniref:hypothetical protein n=1 Tax=unclassified Chitinophaga TaxID=2619133 RepID=UPI003D19F54B
MTENVSGKMIAQEWLKVLPGLSMYGSTRLLKILGPLVIGIQINKIPGWKRYAPYFVFIPLIDVKADGKAGSTEIVIQARDTDNRQLFIPEEKYDVILPAVIDGVLTQFSIPFDRDITQEAIYRMIDYFMEWIEVKARIKYLIGFHLIKLHVALYVDDEAQVRESLRSIRQQAAAVPANTLSAWFGDVAAWEQRLNEMVTNRAAYLEQIREKIQKDKKLSKLSSNDIYR